MSKNIMQGSCVGRQSLTAYQYSCLVYSQLAPQGEHLKFIEMLISGCVAVIDMFLGKQHSMDVCLVIFSCLRYESQSSNDFQQLYQSKKKFLSLSNEL